MACPSDSPVLSVKHLSKSFSGKTVVDGVTFDLYPGEILALVGENGAGKSTTKNMLCGLLTPSSGNVSINGQDLDYQDARKQGISAVHQELSLFQSLSVAENLCINSLPGHALNVNWGMVIDRAASQLEFLGVAIDPRELVSSLGAGKQQIVEIAKALMHADKVLILDEPTTSLTAPEREKLFNIMRTLKAEGVAMVFISHFMDEIYTMCDSFVALRDGQQVGVGSLAEVPRDELESMMVGRKVGESQHQLAPPLDDDALRVESLDSHAFVDISFSLKRGEILGIAGLMGSGRTEVAEAIFGLRPAKGKVSVGGEYVQPLSVSKMKEKQVCYVTEDRRTYGMFSGRSVTENTSAAGIRHFLKRRIKGFGFRGEQQQAEQTTSMMNVSAPSMATAVKNLSGGNQQKVMLGRWLATKPNICILDEPTKGVDIGAKFDIHSMIVELASQGVAVIVVSSDLQELLDVSHRIIVMRTGHIVGEFPREDFDSVKIISMAASSVHDTKHTESNIVRKGGQSA